MTLTFLSLTACLLGYSLFIRRNRSISFAFTPAIASSFIIVALFVGGICRALSFTAEALFWVGLGLFAAELISFISKGKKRAWNTAEIVSTVLWVIGGYILFLYLTRESYFIEHYDNFSHWGIVSRLLLKTDHFPTASEADFISFRSYPVGTAAFIYFFSRRFGLSQSNILLLSQAILVFNFYFSLFGCIQTKNVILRIAELTACSVLMVFLVTFNIRLDQLLVDNVISAVMLACILLAFVHYQRVREYALELGLMAGAGFTVKSSGLMLMVFLLMIAYHFYSLYLERLTQYEDDGIPYLVSGQKNPEPEPKKDIIPYFLLLGIPLCLFVLWKIHSYVTFSMNGISGGKHSGSISYFLASTGNRSERNQKCSIIFPYFFSFSRNRALLPMIGIALLPMIRILPQEDIKEAYKNHRELVSIALISITYYLVYELSLLLMYLLSMSLSEMIAQNGRDYIRYNGTIVSVMAGIMFLLLVRECEACRNWRRVMNVSVVLLGCLAIGYSFSFDINNMPTIESSRRNFPDFYRLEQLMQTDSISADDRILIRYTKDYGVPDNAANYYLYPCRDYTIACNQEAYQKALQEADYTMMIDLVDESIQTQEGKRALEDYLAMYGK